MDLTCRTFGDLCSTSVADNHEFLKKLLSASVVLLMITLESRMILQNISRKVVGNIRNDISPSSIFPSFILMLSIIYQNC